MLSLHKNCFICVYRFLKLNKLSFNIFDLLGSLLCMLKISCSGHYALEVGKPRDVTNFLLNENHETKLQPLDEPSAHARQARNGNYLRCRIVITNLMFIQNVSHKCHVANHSELKMLYHSAGRYG